MQRMQYQRRTLSSQNFDFLEKLCDNGSRTRGGWKLSTFTWGLKCHQPESSRMWQSQIKAKWSRYSARKAWVSLEEKIGWN